MIMRNMNLKMLIAACVLSFFSGATAVNYNFDKSARVSSATSVSDFNNVEQNSFGEVNYQQNVVSGFNMISSQTPTSGKGSLISVQKSSSQTTAQSGGVGHVAANVTFSRDNAERLYDGFDSGVEVVNISPISVKGVDLSGAAKLPGDGGHEPWPPVGDGLLSLLFFAGIYAFARFRRIKN